MVVVDGDASDTASDHSAWVSVADFRWAGAMVDRYTDWADLADEYAD